MTVKSNIQNDACSASCSHKEIKFICRKKCKVGVYGWSSCPIGRIGTAVWHEKGNVWQPLGKSLNKNGNAVVCKVRKCNKHYHWKIIWDKDKGQTTRIYGTWINEKDLSNFELLN